MRNLIVYRKLVVLRLATVLLALLHINVFFLSGIATVASAQTAEKIAEKALAATVYLEMQDRNGDQLGFGSGFFVKPNQIATNFHVIEGASQGTARLVGKPTTYKIEGIIAADKKNDLAVLKVSISGIQPLSISNSDTVKTGSTIYVAGNPKGLKGTFSDGIISGVREFEDGKKRFQMTAPISPGSSGGPVLKGNGEVIGVTYMYIEGGQNLNFAIPSEYLKELLKQSDPAKPFPQDEQSISAETYFHIGNSLLSEKQYDAAIIMYNKSIRLKPDYALAYNNRGMAKLVLEKFAAAITDSTKAIDLKPNLYSAYYHRGDAWRFLGQYDAAIADSTKAIDLKPNFYLAYKSRAHTKLHLKQYKDAITDFDKAISLWTPGHLDDLTVISQMYFMKGMANSVLKRIKEADLDFEYALKLARDAKTLGEDNTYLHFIFDIAKSVIQLHEEMKGIPEELLVEMQKVIR